MQLHPYEEVKVTAPQFILCSHQEKLRFNPKIQVITFFIPFPDSFPVLSL